MKGDTSANWLVSLSFFQNKELQGDSISDMRIENVPLHPKLPPIDNQMEVTQTLFRSRSTSQSSRIGFQATVGFRAMGLGNTIPVKDLKAEVKNINVFLAGKIEFYQRNTITYSRYDSIVGSSHIQTIDIRKSDYGKLRTTEYQTDNVSFFGLGIPFWVLTNNTELRLNSFYGIQGGPGSLFAIYIDFNFTEKQLGLSIGGDYRKSISPNPPAFNIYIAKSITIGDLKQALKFN